MSTALSANASDADILAFIDYWISLLAEEKYAEACRYLETEPSWSAELIRDIIKAYGDEADNKVTLFNNGTAIDGAGNVEVAKQRKEVEWYPGAQATEAGGAGESRGSIWYDLNINGLVSDLTATFDLKRQAGQIHVVLQDIHVM